MTSPRADQAERQERDEEEEELFARYRTWRSAERVRRLPKRIILVRHGESQANIDDSMYATVPDNQIPLSPRGREQAREAGARLSSLIGEDSCAFFISPYTRSRQTFHEILDALQPQQRDLVAVREDPRRREQEWGNFQVPEVMKLSQEERRRVGSFFYRFQSGESGADVYDRVSLFMESLFRTFKKRTSSKNVVVVSHGMTLRLLLMRYFHWSVEAFHDLWNLENCAPVVMEREEGNKRFHLSAPLRSNTGLYAREQEANVRGLILLQRSPEGTPRGNFRLIQHQDSQYIR